MYLRKLRNLLILICCPTIVLLAQKDSLPSLDYANPKEYTIGGINVKGAQWSDEGALINVSGLKIGDQITLPGIKITNGLKALWKLGIFSDVQIFQEKIIGEEIVFLTIQVAESSRLKGYRITGVKKSKVAKLQSLISPYLHIGRLITESQKRNVVNILKQYHIDQGYADVIVHLQEINKEKEKNGVQLIFDIDTNEKIKIARIQFIGNEQISSKKLKKALGLKTKGSLFSSSKLVEVAVQEGKKNIIELYKGLGYLDASIKKDSIWRDHQDDWQVLLEISEGTVYYFGSITWKGNAIYSNEQLAKVLAIQKGDAYDQHKLDSQLKFNLQGPDITSLYMDNGYLFFQVDAIQTAIRQDTIDLQIRIVEGPLATIDKVTIKGNSRTHEHVIRREIRTKPNKKFSRSDIIRSQRQIVNLGFFNPESLDINTSINPERGTVDIEYEVEEKQSDQFELSAGWGGRNTGLIGTIGVSFNNLSLQKLFKPTLWNPLPMGDGQRASIRFQANGRAYQSLNMSITEPWLGGKRSNMLTTSLFYSRFNSNPGTSESNNSIFNVFGANISLGRPLSFPDDNFIATTSLGFQKYTLQNWASGLFSTDDGQVINNGTFHNFSLTQTIARSTVNHPIFPTSGSSLSMSLQLTPPYSLLAKKEYATLDEAEQFKWLEYHKWRFNFEWYTPLSEKLVLKAGAKMGFLGNYNSALGSSPFERFQLGGDGLSNSSSGYTGTDIISLRGYEVEDLENNFSNGSKVATPIFNKFTVELRYLLSANPNATLYGLAFLEAGNAYSSFKKYNPFDLKRSVGVGLRAHLPMIGTIGVDYGVGFDKAGARNFNNFGKISVILGFEPE